MGVIGDVAVMLGRPEGATVAMGRPKVDAAVTGRQVVAATAPREAEEGTDPLRAATAAPCAADAHRLPRATRDPRAPTTGGHHPAGNTARARMAAGGNLPVPSPARDT